jgi:hypothetical protein
MGARPPWTTATLSRTRAFGFVMDRGRTARTKSYAAGGRPDNPDKRLSAEAGILASMDDLLEEQTVTVGSWIAALSSAFVLISQLVG